MGPRETRGLPRVEMGLQEKLTEMEFVEDLEVLEEMFEKHKVDNRDIQDFRQDVDECIARQAEVSAEDTYEYCELLRVLESEYQQLRDLSAGRMLDLVCARLVSLFPAGFPHRLRASGAAGAGVDQRARGDRSDAELERHQATRPADAHQLLQAGRR